MKVNTAERLGEEDVKVDEVKVKVLTEAEQEAIRE